ncbi:hydrogenase expression/formation protein HypE [Methanococcoides seepicolus]|uniref:Hydrogenase expression/formation protein HypE n=1 Tax=Methanococcoides seepicolus TaxID=2828780 RepID=A0A9E4ZE84_9EURY|nr:hydrogenase expression/formation protein HypE [Methanococcoides seepicolus]MCM1985574.1 hydrogenase expression/formation protein HypE [Methanococcoides seepicolus]
MTKKNIITMEHGAGGQVMQGLISKSILGNISNRSAGTVGLDDLDDGATIALPADFNSSYEIVITTDSHVVKPLFFPGGDIGKLAVCGTVNDLTVMGARPVALTCAIVVSEGFEREILEEIIQSMDLTAKEARVAIVTGDTKTIPRNELDSIIINTSGIGFAPRIIRDNGLSPEDMIILTGTIGDHGISLLSHREGFNFNTKLESDVSPLNDLLEKSLQITTHDGRSAITAMKDPTRGGLSASINEMTQKSNVGVILEEEDIPIKSAVRSACEMLGLDPYEIANEGKAIMGVRPEYADEVLELLHSHKYGKDAAIIGKVVAEHQGKVLLRTPIGSLRQLNMPVGDPIPRVC